MFSRIFLRCNSVTNYSISQTPVRRYLSQTIVSLKPTLTRVFGDAPFFGVSKINISALRSGVCKHNGKIFGERNASRFAAVQRSSSTLDVDTNVTNNVFLYKYEKPKLYNFLNILAPLQAIFWFCVSYSMYQFLPNYDANNTSLSRYALDNVMTIACSVTAVAMGLSSSLLLWAFTAKSVRYIILQKGGKMVSFMTYHPSPKKAWMTVPVQYVSCRTTRKSMKNYLPLKVKGRSLFYVLDANGEFTNTKIFDNVIATSKWRGEL